jgi:HK97 gp10 family phage protein
MARAGGGVGGDLSIDGLQPLLKKLDALGPKLAGKIGRRALREGAKIFQQQAKANAPVKDGLLKGSIRVRAGKRSRTGISYLVQTGEGFFKGETFYGAFVELGHKAGSRKLGDDRAKVEARPFLRPAFDQKKAAAQRAVERRLKQGIESG